MAVSGRRKSIVFFVTLGACLVALALTLNISWLLLPWSTGLLYFLGLLFFLAIIAGVVLNTIFLVREIRRSEQQDHFLHAVTHELKTPVASIRLYLQTLQTRQVDEAKRQEFYAIMLADSDRLLDTIEQVLRAGKATRTARPIQAVRINLSELVQECMQLARTRHHLPPESLQSVARRDAEHIQVLGDPDELRGAVLNLLDNAIKYSGAEVHVQVDVTRLDGRLAAVRVKDRGIGIPTHELKRVFGRFYRIPGGGTMRVKGTGLGLFIVRSVAERHGGKAFAESPGLGLGSTFTLQLPLALES